MTDTQQSLNETVTTQVSDKELNFRKQEAMYKRMLEDERNARLELERKISQQPVLQEEDDDDSDEPYVDHKKLNKKLANFERNMDKKIDQKAQEKASMMIEQERINMYLRENSDFSSVMGEESGIVQKFADMHPRIAENILRMPAGFDREKLVYETIKAMGMHKPKAKEQSVQEKIDSNRRSPYYQPSGISPAAYDGTGDFSAVGQSNAYKKMQELKQRLNRG